MQEKELTEIKAQYSEVFKHHEKYLSTTLTDKDIENMMWESKRILAKYNNDFCRRLLVAVESHIQEIRQVMENV